MKHSHVLIVSLCKDEDKLICLPISSVGDPVPHVFGPPGSGSLPFLINVLSGLK
jgi:hypothetical protein